MNRQSVEERRLEDIKNVYVLWNNMHISGNEAMFQISKILKREYRIGLDVEVYMDGDRIGKLVEVDIAYDKE